MVVGVLYAEFGYVHKNNYPNIFDLVYMYLSESYSLGLKKYIYF